MGKTFVFLKEAECTGKLDLVREEEERRCWNQSFWKRAVGLEKENFSVDVLDHPVQLDTARLLN